MNKYRLDILLGSTVACILASNSFTQPLLAQETATQVQPNSSSISTSAVDLISDYQLAQVIRDLDKFCTDFPYNSRCAGRSQPSTEVEVETKPSKTRRTARSRSPKSKTGWAIVPEASTLGLGGSVVKQIIPQLNARAGINAFGFGFDLEDTDATYEADLNLFNVSTLADYHPFKNSGFRLSGGLIFSNNNVEGTATPSFNGSEETIEIGDETFEADELASVDADFDITSSVAPYLGIGWGNPVSGNKGLGFFANLGVVFGSSPEVDITPNVADGVPQEVQNEINEAVARETEDLEDELDFISVYPVASLGLSYQF